MVALWSLAGLFITQVVINVNGRVSLPTEAFLKGGTGKVLDIGAGTGRSSIMVLASRPKATLVALDLFAESFDQHFGPSTDPQARLASNLKIAGVDERASIVTADMRKLPFEPNTFDAAVSAFAVDHLGRDGSVQALKEAGRVVKPGGDFLLMVITNEPWAHFAFGPLLAHGGPRSVDWWTSSLGTAGFDVVEHGVRPLTLYILSHRK